MSFRIDPDDIEPICATERCDQFYGPHHIGRDDETRDELALFFDAQLFPEPNFLTQRLWSIINRFGGRFCALSEYVSDEHLDHQLDQLLLWNAKMARTFDGVSKATPSVAIVELAKPTVTFVDAALRPYTAYYGYGNIGWPSTFRSIITANQQYL